MNLSIDNNYDNRRKNERDLINSSVIKQIDQVTRSSEAPNTPKHYAIDHTIKRRRLR